MSPAALKVLFDKFMNLRNVISDISLCYLPPSCTEAVCCLWFAPALPVEVPDCGRGPQNQKPQLSAGQGA